MPTQLIHMLESTYPFGQAAQQDSKNRILIKQTISKSSNNFTQILRIAKIAKKISQNKIFIKLQTILQQEESVCLLYEYIPIKVSKYIKAMDQKFLKQYRYQLYQIAQILAQNRIITNIDISNMGLNQKYQAKYFLGMNFVQKKQVNIYQLKNDYIQQIKRIFGPYFNSEALVAPKKVSKNLVKVDNRMSDTQQIQNVSSYVDNRNNLVKTRKHQSIYYEKDKDKQIKKRKQSYMSSVSNLRLNNLYRRINQIQLQVCNTKSPNKNGFKFSIQGRQFTSKTSYDKKAIQGSKLKGITNGLNRNSGNLNSSNNNNYGNINYNHMNKNNVGQKNNYIKYPGYQNQQQYSQQLSQFQDYQKSIRSNKPNRYAIKNTLQMSAHTRPIQKTQKQHMSKKPYKKFSTQFPSLSDLQQPLMALTSALRISANGLDKQQRKVNKKIQMFKQKEYSEMKSISGNVNYIQDFMSVLEQQNSTNQRTSKNNQNDYSNNQNEHQSQQNDLQKPTALKITSQQSIQDTEFHPVSSQPLKIKNNMSSPIHHTVTSYSHSHLPLTKPTVLPLTQSNQIIESDQKKIKSKPSIQQSINNVNIHNRVKGVIQNSKRLIQKLKEKAKKN